MKNVLGVKVEDEKMAQSHFFYMTFISFDENWKTHLAA